MRYGLLRFGSLLLVASVALPSSLFGQGMRGMPGGQEDVQRPVQEWYTVGGVRHGVSYFPQAYFPSVEYEAGATLTFDHYHTMDVMYEWMHRWEERYPNLVEVWEEDRSFEGRPILMAVITNKSTGPATDKPAAYFEGGRHAGEVTASESALWLMKYLLDNYGTDDEVTRLVDTRAIYFRPKNNPDGSELYLNTAQTLRSTVRPDDNDGDGLLDEDAADDIDGDGVIRQVRYHPRPGTNDRATMVTDERDPQGRLMRRAEPGEEAEWVVTSEGLDNDGDGRVNEDGIGGLDLHRNYLENWRPERGAERTGRGYTQGGAGAYPLSEIETRSVVVFLLENPNVSVVNSMDTSVPMHLRPPSTSASPERMYPEDLALYEYFDSLGVSITHYPYAGDVYHDYSSRRGQNDDPLSGSPLFGHGPDFGYWYYGSIWYGDELWNGGDFGDVNGDGQEDQLDVLVWDDANNGGQAFKEWEPFHHPTLGEVEIGGLEPKFLRQNPPAVILEEWAAKEGLFNLALAEHLPLLELDRPRVRRVDEEDDVITYEVQARWTNAGGLPTALRQAQLVKIVREDQAVVEFDSSLTRGTEPRVTIVEPSRGGAVEVGWTDAGASNSATFRIQVRGSAPVEGTVRLLSTRGGVVESTFTLGGS